MLHRRRRAAIDELDRQFEGVEAGGDRDRRGEIAAGLEPVDEARRRRLRACDHRRIELPRLALPFEECAQLGVGGVGRIPRLGVVAADADPEQEGQADGDHQRHGKHVAGHHVHPVGEAGEVGRIDLAEHADEEGDADRESAPRIEAVGQHHLDPADDQEGSGEDEDRAGDAERQADDRRADLRHEGEDDQDRGGDVGDGAAGRGGRVGEADEGGRRAHPRRAEQPADQAAEAVAGDAAGDVVHVRPLPVGVVDALRGGDDADRAERRGDGGGDECGHQRRLEGVTDERRIGQVDPVGSGDGGEGRRADHAGGQRHRHAEREADERRDEPQHAAPPDREADAGAEGDQPHRDVGDEAGMALARRIQRFRHTHEPELQADDQDGEAGDERLEDDPQPVEEPRQPDLDEGGEHGHPRHRGQSPGLGGEDRRGEVDRRVDRRREEPRAEEPPGPRLQHRAERRRDEGEADQVGRRVGRHAGGPRHQHDHHQVDADQDGVLQPQREQAAGWRDVVDAIEQIGRFGCHRPPGRGCRFALDHARPWCKPPAPRCAPRKTASSFGADSLRMRNSFHAAGETAKTGGCWRWLARKF